MPLVSVQSCEYLGQVGLIKPVQPRTQRAGFSIPPVVTGDRVAAVIRGNANRRDLVSLSTVNVGASGREGADAGAVVA